jgi:hypothetical protein
MLYRIVLTDPPTLQDFTTDAAMGRPPPSQHPDAIRLADGLSAYATLAQARNKARVYPWLGRYVAMLDIPTISSIRFERTLPGSRGHHTVWGDPIELLACVVSVVPSQAAT